MSATALISAIEFEKMSFDQPVELIRGELIWMTNPGLKHGAICGNVTFVLKTWAYAQGDFIIASNDVGVLTTQNPDSVRGPDVAVISKQALPTGELSSKMVTTPPTLVVEVKSPSNSWSDLINKAAEFLNAGVQEVWVIDPETQHLHRYQLDNEPTIYTEQDQLSTAALPNFQSAVSEFFRDLDN